MVTSFRMYNAAPGAARAWRALFSRVFADAGLEVPIVAHGWPDPIEALWARPDLCCDFMCGWPFARSDRRMQPIAVPVPAPASYEGRPRYRSEFLVREASGWSTLDETFGHRVGWMAENSQSGFNAPRALLSAHAAARGGKLYAESKGPLGTPARTLDALRAAEVDVVALDSFYLDLLRRHDPARMEGLRCVATTRWTPMPLLVAAPGIAAEAVALMRALLVSIHAREGYPSLLAEACIERFEVPDLAAYDALEAMAREAHRRGYGAIR